MYKLRYVAEMPAIRAFYQSSVESIMAYGIILWGSSPHMATLFKMQKQFIRCMLHLEYRESCKPHFESLDLLTLPCLYIYRLLCYCKKNMTLFTTNRDFAQSERTRGAYRLAVPRHALTIYEKGPYHMMIRTYNALPLSVSSIDSFGLFKKRLRKHLIARTYYSVNEYLTDR